MEPGNGTVRAPTDEERAYLRLKLEREGEDVTAWDERAVLVIEHGGVISGCVAARLVWQLEPLWLTPEFRRDAPPVTLRRAVFKLARGMESWLRDRGVRFYFAHICKKPMQRVAREYGLMPVYRGTGKLFGREL